MSRTNREKRKELKRIRREKKQKRLTNLKKGGARHYRGLIRDNLHF